ncbi:terminase small subunit [Domibacillus indicus]|uniref:terminase small subunit n=1 Tax=Domibacillus indicus TaxID=1437523 RepID=UPI002041D4CC|nr:terminase small subunit [Domibacillus indicus]MCM3789439.1 terminase small subunit [Domibacillus indicus]
MARPRDPNRDKAHELYKQHKGNITNRAIAEQLGIDEKKVAVWKQRDKWNVVQQTKKNVVQQKKKHTKKARSPNKKAKEESTDSAELTDKQWFFCLYYLKYFNATKAYIQAYGCSYATANVEGYRTLVKPSVKNEIERMKKERAEGILLDAESILQKYIDIAFADIKDYVEFGQKEELQLDPRTGEPLLNKKGEPLTYNYSFVNLKNADEFDGTIITEVKKGKAGVSVKLADRMKALEKLEIYTDLLPDHFKRRIEEEKLKLAQQQAGGGNKNEDSQSWVAAVQEVAARRRALREGNGNE